MKQEEQQQSGVRASGRWGLYAKVESVVLRQLQANQVGGPRVHVLLSPVDWDADVVGQKQLLASSKRGGLSVSQRCSTGRARAAERLGCPRALPRPPCVP